MAEFADRLPGWCDRATGLPLSWRHFVYGQRYLGRAFMREQLQHADAARIAHHASGEEYTTWLRDGKLMTTPPEGATDG